jgi:hypothetical protein
MSKSKSSTLRRRLGRAGLATGAATTLLTALSAAPAYAAAGTLALSSTGGPTAGGNTIVATFANPPTSPNPTAFTSTTAVYFVVATSATATSVTCPTTYPTTAPATNLVATGSPAVKLLAPSKIAVTVPAGVVVTAGGIYRYGMCAFASNSPGAALIASGQYTVGNKPTIASVGGIAPLSGPALGGTSVTVTGTGFVANTTAQPNNTTASIDGEPLSNIVVAGNGNSFTATTPPHAAGGPYLLAVTTPGGTVNTLGNTTGKASLFNYSNGIVVSPNTAPNYRGNVDLDVLGVGFSNYTFDTTSGGGQNHNSAGAHVYLSSPTGYNPDQVVSMMVGTGVKTSPAYTECINVLVISNEELLCTLPLNHTYDRAAVANASAAALTAAAARTSRNVTTVTGSTSITSTNAAFTQNDVGLPVSATGITATTIASVQSATQATLAAAASADGTVADMSVGGARSAITGTVASDRKTITGTSGFTQADVGRAISSTNGSFPANTTITSVSADGTTVGVSDASTMMTPAQVTDIVVTPSTPVSNGAYSITVVNSGALDANDSASYQQSIISSGSTFTVSDY